MILENIIYIEFHYFNNYDIHYYENEIYYFYESIYANKNDIIFLRKRKFYNEIHEYWNSWIQKYE